MQVIGGQGQPGRGKTKIGTAGKDVIVRIPLGTTIRRDGKVVADIVGKGEKFIAARGGCGGRGNTGGPIASRPTKSDDPAVSGLPGEEIRYELELKTIADVGLVGLPNAGKSTFLGAVSHAHPKVAAYPFTTLNPHLGTVEFPDHGRFTVADIPGLAIGAAENKGLGHRFLRHIARAKILLFLIDASAETGSMPACAALDALQHELVEYDPALARRPAIIAATKMDVGGTATEQLQKLKAHTSVPVVGISSHSGDGITDLTTKLRYAVETLKRREEEAAEPKESIHEYLRRRN